LAEGLRHSEFLFDGLLTALLLGKLTQQVLCLALAGIIEEVIADVEGRAGDVILIIYLKGNIHTEITRLRRRRG